MQELGGRFDGWTEHFQFERWERGASARRASIRLAFTARAIRGEPLPWDHIDLGVTRDWLLREREHALRGETDRRLPHRACTMCGMGGPRDRKLAPRELEPAQWDCA